MAGLPAPPRFELPMSVVTPEGLWGITLNVSATGALVATPDRPAIGTALALTLWHEDTPIECVTRVVRTDKTGVGLQFVGTTGHFRRTLHQILGRARPAPCENPGYGTAQDE